MHLKMSGKWQPFCLSLNVLTFRVILKFITLYVVCFCGQRPHDAINPHRPLVKFTFDLKQQRLGKNAVLVCLIKASLMALQ